MSGAVTVVRGGRRGLSTSHQRVLRGDEDESSGDMGFGERLAAGDLDADGRVDLVVASAGYVDSGDDSAPGSVSYCRGAGRGLARCNRLVHGVQFAGASSLVLGNLWGTSRPEIVLGLPDAFDDDNGKVEILQLRGGAKLEVTDSRTLDEYTQGVPGEVDPDAHFGKGVALGDLDRDGFADLVVGAAAEDDLRGRVYVVHGDAAGLRTTGSAAYSQDTLGIPGVAEPGDRFGSSVALLDHDGDGHLDLTVGAPGEDGSGAVTTFRGVGAVFAAKGSRTIGLSTLGLPAVEGAELGSSLPQR